MFTVKSRFSTARPGGTINIVPSLVAYHYLVGDSSSYSHKNRCILKTGWCVLTMATLLPWYRVESRRQTEEYKAETPCIVCKLPTQVVRCLQGYEVWTVGWEFHSRLLNEDGQGLALCKTGNDI